MCNDHTLLHLSNAERSSMRATLHRLSGKHAGGSSTDAVQLIDNILLQSGVQRWTDEDLRGDLVTRHPVIHPLVPIALKAQLLEFIAMGSDIHWAEDRTVNEAAFDGCHFARG